MNYSLHEEARSEECSRCDALPVVALTSVTCSSYTCTHRFQVISAPDLATLRNLAAKMSKYLRQSHIHTGKRERMP